MAIANWKTKGAPEKTGDYLATVRGRPYTDVVRYNKAVCAEGGRWVEDVFGFWQEVDVVAWDDLPEGYKHDV